MRYIDADRFDVITSQRHSEDFMDGMDYILDMIDKAPTEDVVPRSEYELVVSALDNSTKEFLKLHDDFKQSKQEVANKIVNIVADLMWQGESEKLNILIGGVYCNKQEFIDKIKKYIGE